nr:hypothetical protein [Coxiella burnetii]
MFWRGENKLRVSCCLHGKATTQDLATPSKNVKDG